MQAITITGQDYEALRRHLLHPNSNREEAAVLLAGISRTDTQTSLLVREVFPVPDDAFQIKGSAYLSIHPDFLAPLIKRCRLEGFGFILAHSHPFADKGVHFSGVDDAGEAELFPRIQRRAPNTPHATMVLGRSSLDARLWLPGETYARPVDMVKVVGDALRKVHPTSSPLRYGKGVEETHVRQVLAFGKEGQRLIQAMRVTIVGVGGVGSMVYQELVHLGVGDVMTVDDQTLEESNLSRVVGSTPEDVGKPKVDVMMGFGKKINPHLQVQGVYGSVEHWSVAKLLRDRDVILCCTDNLKSRIVLNRIAHQYLIPVIDMGVDIQLVNGQPGRVRAVGGRVMVIYPDGPCLGCLGILSPQAIHEEELRENRSCSYVQGQAAHAPAVISLNGVVASLGVTEFINLVTGFAPRPERIYQRYDAIKGLVRAYRLVPEEKCTLCMEVKGLGDLEQLPCYLDQ